MSARTKLDSRVGIWKARVREVFDLTWIVGMAQTEGKQRKSPQKAAKGRTLFVRNLPYSTSDAQLSSVFEKYGGIKSCFTVKDKGGLQIEYFALRKYDHHNYTYILCTFIGVIDRCKGFGYILFEKRCVHFFI